MMEKKTDTQPECNGQETLQTGQAKRPRITLRKKSANTGSSKGQRPQVEVQDATGLPQLRPARTIGELPAEDQNLALQEVTQHLAGQLGLVAVKTIHATTPVFAAFKDMHRQRAKNHLKAKLLLANGSELTLDLVPRYNP